MNNKGQSVFSEYVMIFFVVIAAAVAMTTFVQRGLKARIHDARNYLIQTVNRACDSNCKNATGSTSIPYEYEPYYEQYAATVQNFERDTSGATSGKAQVLGVQYLSSQQGQATSLSTSVQLPALCSAPNPPSCCFSTAGCQGGKL